MRIGTLAIGFTVAGLLAIGTGCSQHHDQAAANGVPNTMALAQGDKVARALMKPVAQPSEVADTRAESAPLD